MRVLAIQSIRKLFEHTELLFLGIALPVGLVLSLLTPPGAGFDETTHLARVWEISLGKPIPNSSLHGEGIGLPIVFHEVSYRSRLFNTPLEPQYYERYAERTIDLQTPVLHQTRSVYFPASLIPQAALLAFMVRYLDSPVLVVYHALRIVQLAMYLALVYLAIRIIPLGKWVLTLLALAPMALLQASTISADAYTNGASFLFIAWVLSLKYQASDISRRQVFLTLLLVALVLAGKPGTAFLPALLFLLPLKKFSSRPSALLLAAGTLFLFAALAIGWNALAYSTFSTSEGASASEQLSFLLANPWNFVQAIVTSMQRIPVHLPEWIGVYGYKMGRVPPIVYPFFGAALLLALWADAGKQNVQRSTRLSLLTVFVIGYLSTVSLLYLTYTGVGGERIAGIQGRYFIPVAPLLLLGLIPQLAKLPDKLMRIVAPAATTMALLALFVYTAGVYFSFHVTCGIYYYTSGLCYQPAYRNWEPNSYFSEPLISGGGARIIFQQTFKGECSPITAFRVWPESPEGADTFTIFNLYDLNSGELLVEQNISNATAPFRSWWEFEFGPIESAIDRFFVAQFTSTSTDPERAIELAITSRQEYGLGEFSIDGEPQPADLIFQYGCAQP